MNRVNILARPGLQQYLQSEGVLSSATRKLSIQFKEQWLRHLQDHRLLLAANLIVFKDWLESTAFIHEDLLAQTNSKFQDAKSHKQVLLHPMLMILPNQKNQNVRSKMESTPFGVVRNLNQWSWTSDENMYRSSDCVSIAWDLVICQKIAKAELAVYTIVDDDTTSFCTATSQRRRRQQAPQMLRQQ